jgi:hypothetical protein
MGAKKARGSLALFVLMASCGGHHQPNGEGTSGEDLARVPESASAHAEIAALRTRHRFAAAYRDTAQPLPAATQAAVIGPSLAVEFHRNDGKLVPAFEDGARERRVKLELARHGNGAFRIEHLPSGVALSPRLVGAHASEAEVTEGYVVYRGAAPGGGALVHRVTEEGTEDYLTFANAPAVEEAIYEVELSASVAGLRLVERTLEALDSSGTPRLHVSPPFIVGADGKRHEASLDVSRCNVDTNPSAPWGRPTVAPGSSRCTVRVSWAGAGVTYPALLDPSWNSAGNMTRLRWLAAATLLQNGKVLVSGGETNGFVTTATAELYDPVTRTWAATGSMQSPRRQHRSLRLPNGNAMVSGGTESTTFFVWATTERYDSSSGTWAPLATMAHQRWQHTVTLLSTGNVLVAGGTLSQTPKAELYNPSTNVFSPTTDMLSVQQGHTATLLNNGRVLVVGNDPSPSEIHAQIYNPTNATWTATSPVAVRRMNHTATLLANGTVLVAGGMWPGGQFGDFVASRAAEIYDPVANTWTRTGSTTHAHTDGTANLLSSGKVLLVGEDVPGTPRTTPEIFNPTWGTWSPTPAIASPRSGHVSARLANNRILVAGGHLQTTGTNAEEFDPTTTATTAVEYKIDAMVHQDVVSDRVTELWAVMHRPSTLAAGTRYPLLLFLHGQHETCGKGSNPRIDDNDEYATTGNCTSPYQPVPNHRGYDYIASELASRGYIVVSINANRGINSQLDTPPNDPSFILARGRLVLKHLQYLSEWDRGVRAIPTGLGNLLGRIDFSHVGLMGHSRGGEGMRAAYEQYRDAGSIWPGRIVTPLNFRGIFEIGSTDGPTEGQLGQRTLNALNTKWVGLYPMCDADNPHLPSVATYDRMLRTFNEGSPAFKATYGVWGANHNFYNTEWQESDAFDCRGNHRPMFLPPQPGVTGSAEQRQSGFYPMLAFFTANVGPATNPALNNVFDPKTPLVSELPIQRGYTPGANTSHSRQLEDFLGVTGRSTFGLSNGASNISISHQLLTPNNGVATYHDRSHRAALISWSSAGSNTYFQTNFAASGSGFNLTSYQMLDIRLDRTELNSEPLTSFEVALVTSNNTLSNRVWIDGYGLLRGPVEGWADGFHRLLQTNRIPLSAFGVSLGSIRGVRLIFSGTPSGSIWVANIRASRVTTPP